jgi:hypothetical protein
MVEIWEKKYIVKLIDQIKDKKILLQLYKIILDNKINFTRNSNGIFINLNQISEEHFNLIKNFLYNLNYINE